MILCAASPVFEAMLYSKFSEGAAVNSIRITDISYGTFDAFLNYIYTGELSLDNDRAMDRLMELSYCAQKYLIEDMRKQCLKKLSEFLTHDTILMFLGKSFDMHLEDFLVSCLYFIADALETGASLSNLLLNNAKFHLPSRCFEFLVKNLLDYLGERDNILILIKAWCFLQCQEDNLDVSDDAQAVTLGKLNLDDRLTEKVVQLKSSFCDALSASRTPKSFHRVYYKPVRPLIIEQSQLTVDTNVSFRRFATVSSLMVNSRLVPEQFDICDMSNQTYTEQLSVEIVDKASRQSLYNQQHRIDNVSFNAFFSIKLDNQMVLFPHHFYVIKLTWSAEAIGFEYPRCIFSLMEKGSDDDKGPTSVVQFHEYSYIYNSPFGSIVQGISYDLLS